MAFSVCAFSILSSGFPWQTFVFLCVGGQEAAGDHLVSSVHHAMAVCPQDWYPQLH